MVGDNASEEIDASNISKQGWALKVHLQDFLELTQRLGGIYMEGMPTLRVSLRDFHRMWLSIPLLGRRLSAWPGYKLEIRRPRPDLSFWVGDLPDRFFCVPQAPSKKITMPPSGSLGFQARLCLEKVRGTVPRCYRGPSPKKSTFPILARGVAGPFFIFHGVSQCDSRAQSLLPSCAICRQRND